MGMEDEFESLKLVADLAGRHEVNVMLVPPADGAVGYLQAMDTPKASRVICASGGGYDIWRGNKLVRANQAAVATANLVIAEYTVAKAKRVRRLYPHLTMRQILDVLLKGYQNKPPVVVVGTRRRPN